MQFIISVGLESCESYKSHTKLHTDHPKQNAFFFLVNLNVLRSNCGASTM